MPEPPPSGSSVQDEKLRLAEEWLEKHRDKLRLDELVPRDVPPAESTSSSSRPPPRPRGYADVSDEDATDVDEDDGTSELGRKVVDAYSREARKLMRAFVGDDLTDEEARQLERHRDVLRKIRSDPPIAPDEPAPMTLRPYDVAPGDRNEDVKFVYKHALTTVRETKRFAARRFAVPVEALDLVLGGRRLADERTLAECGVMAGHVAYVRVDKKRLAAVLTTTVETRPGADRVPITRMKKTPSGRFVLE
jgi:hypothetical protein